MVQAVGGVYGWIPIAAKMYVAPVPHLTGYTREEYRRILPHHSRLIEAIEKAQPGRRR